MKIVYNLLKEFVDVTAPAAEPTSRLSLAGVAVDSMRRRRRGQCWTSEVTANRPDCLGHFGMAREMAAIYRLPVKPLAAEVERIRGESGRCDARGIEAPELCGRYTARMMRGVKVQPSPEWLRQRLAAIGQNSINNVVDVTNYVMFELGQPLHAFDLDKLQERRIVVRRARAGEKSARWTAPSARSRRMCVIADASRAVAIAGVMGGSETEIGFSSRNILIESAWFDPSPFAGLRRRSVCARSVLSLRARSGSGNGGAGVSPHCGIDPANCRRRNSRGRRWTHIRGGKRRLRSDYRGGSCCG